MFLNLKLCIYETGIRQNRLAQMVGIDEAVLSKIINGFREPTSTQRRCIAECLQKDERWLFERYTIPRIAFRTGGGSQSNLA